MQIQWFPGHMNKARNEMRETLPKIDLIIELLDARIPFSSENPMLDRLAGDKPRIKLLNKSDLADPEVVALWQQYFEARAGTKSLTLNATQTDYARRLTQLCEKMLPAIARSDRSIRVMVVGIPNVGKSTLINSLAGKAIAKTGDQPAITRGQQLIKLPQGLLLSDTPGVLWPNLENPNSGYRLAVTGAIKDTAIDHVDVALFAAEYLSSASPQTLAARYQLESAYDSPLETLEAIGRARGCLVKGGTVNLDKAAKILLTEIRAGQLGPLCWETPAMMERELAQLEQIRADKAAKKQARKQRRQGRQV